MNDCYVEILEITCLFLLRNHEAVVLKKEHACPVESETHDVLLHYILVEAFDDKEQLPSGLLPIHLLCPGVCNARSWDVRTDKMLGAGAPNPSPTKASHSRFSFRYNEAYPGTLRFITLIQGYGYSKRIQAGRTWICVN